MSDEIANTQPAAVAPQQTGITLFHHEYTKKLILSKAQESGLPVSFIQKPLEQLWDTLAQQGFVLGRANDSAAQQALNSRLMPPGSKNIVLGFKAQ